MPRLTVGEVITILQRDGAWWRAESNGKQGIVPSNYVDLCDESKLAIALYDSVQLTEKGVLPFIKGDKIVTCIQLLLMEKGQKR